MQTMDWIETCAYGSSKNLVCKNEESKCSNNIKENIEQHNPNWPRTLHHPHRVLITGATGFEEINA